MNNKLHFDVLVIGAGISGISAAYYLQTECPNKTYAILEGRSDIGGTWDLFKYPGIRSDSDMYTLGFRFRPWTDPKAIADGPAIMKYLHETVEEYDIQKHIRFNQHVSKASWSSEQALWTLETKSDAEGNRTTYTCNFLSMCTGYYNYEGGFTPDFAGKDDFKGAIIHPQKWTSDIDYKDKRIIVVGSGATAVTLVPELAKKAHHVYMLQRSPTYMVSAPDTDWLANKFNKYLPARLAYSLTRWKKILFGRFTFWLTRKYPKTMKKLMIKGIKKELGEDYDVETHFTPRYNPWDQRVCLVPNSDLFEAIKNGKASVETDHVERFTPKGILLKSGKELEADMIITATGLDLKLMAGMDYFVDGEKVDFSKTVSYRSMMFSDVPNLSLAFGYTNASWTLKCDLTNKYVCRVLNFMDENGYKICTPKIKDPDMKLEPWLDFTSGYIQRKIHLLPKSGTQTPWKLKQNYLFDRIMLSKGKVDDGILEFTGPITKEEKSAVETEMVK